MKGLLEALEVANSKRAHFVRSLSFKGIAHDTEESGTIYKILAKTLALKALKLRATHGSSFEGPFFQQNPVFALTDLRLSSFRLQDKDQCLLRFLESQRCLQTLYLHAQLCSSEDEAKDIFSSAAFPKLKVLSVHLFLVHAFLRTSARLTHLRVSSRVPGRVATRVSGHFARAHSPGPDSTCTDTLCTDTLETLSCSDIFDADAVVSLASLCPNLKWLSGPIATVTKLECLYTRNRELRGLHFNRFSFESALSPGDMPRLFGPLPTLQFVDDNKARWYRGAVTSTPIRWLGRPDERWLADWIEDAVTVNDESGIGDR
ncbi:hypothetical protein AB1N83_008044 [Pleurotus pulmonarius]